MAAVPKEARLRPGAVERRFVDDWRFTVPRCVEINLSDATLLDNLAHRFRQGISSLSSAITAARLKNSGGEWQAVKGNNEANSRTESISLPDVFVPMHNEGSFCLSGLSQSQVDRAVKATLLSTIAGLTNVTVSRVTLDVATNASACGDAIQFFFTVALEEEVTLTPQALNDGFVARATTAELSVAGAKIESLSPISVVLPRVTRVISTTTTKATSCRQCMDNAGCAASEACVFESGGGRRLRFGSIQQEGCCQAR